MGSRFGVERIRRQEATLRFGGSGGQPAIVRDYRANHLPLSTYCLALKLEPWPIVFYLSPCQSLRPGRWTIHSCSAGTPIRLLRLDESHHIPRDFFTAGALDVSSCQYCRHDGLFRIVQDW